jgi:hypothetical protein
MIFYSLFVYTLLFSLLSPGLALSNLPLSTSGRNIIDTTGRTVTYVGVNWPGHMAGMIPEGLQYQSIENIVAKIKSVGFNAIRLTFAVEMVDQILSGGDVKVQRSIVNALGEKEGSKVWEEVRKKNPGFGEGVTRLKVGLLIFSPE